MPKRIDWTSENIDYLRSHYLDASWEEMASHIGCSSASVIVKCRSLGLRKPHVYRPKRVWSDSELRYLCDHFPFESAGDIADVIGVTYPLVMSKAKELGLRKSADYNVSKKYMFRYVRNYVHNVNNYHKRDILPQ